MAVISVEELEKSGANPYEIAIAASKRARILNELQRKGEPADKEKENPSVLALKEIAEGRIKCVYPPEKKG